MPLGLHQKWNSIAPAQSQGPVLQPAFQDRRPMGPSPFFVAQSQGAAPQVAYPRNAPWEGDGTGGPTRYINDFAYQLAQGEAQRQAASTTPPLAGLFGGGAAFPSPTITYLQPGITNTTNQFDDLSRWLAQRQLSGYHEPGYVPTFGRQGWEQYRYGY